MDARPVIVIPARHASTRFPGKPLADIAGTSMIRRVWGQCRRSRLAERVIVATDDERIRAHVADFGGEAVMTPAELRSGSERVAFVASRMDNGIYINVQGDEPLISPDAIDAVIAPLLDGTAPAMTTAASAFADAGEIGDPNVVKAVCTADGRALYFSRAPIPFDRDGAAAPGTHLRHIGIYGFRRDALMRFAALPESPLERIERLEQLRALEAGIDIRVVRVDYESLSVDVPDDIARIVEALRRGES